MMLVKVGHGVGAGLIIGGTPLFGSRFAAGEIGHVVVGTDGGAACACGKVGCLETWLATPRLDAALAAVDDTPVGAGERDAILRRAGERLGIALAPVVGALDLAEVVLSGPVELLDGPLAEAAIDTLRSRTMAEFHGDLILRMTALGQGHRHARRRRHGPVGTARGFVVDSGSPSPAARIPRTVSLIAHEGITR